MGSGSSGSSGSSGNAIQLHNELMDAGAYLNTGILYNVMYENCVA